MSVADNPQREYGDQTLQQFGYRQEFRRELKRFASFAIGFSFISMNYNINTTIGTGDEEPHLPL